MVVPAESSCFGSPFCWLDGDSVYFDDGQMWRPFENTTCTGIEMVLHEEVLSDGLGWSRASSPSGSYSARVQKFWSANVLFDEGCKTVSASMPGVVRSVAWNLHDMLGVLDSIGNVGVFGCRGTPLYFVPAPISWPKRGSIELPACLQWIGGQSGLVFLRGHHVFVVSLEQRAVRCALSLEDDYSNSYVSGLCVSTDGYSLAVKTCALRDYRIILRVHEAPSFASAKCVAFKSLRGFPAVLSFF